jgi:hypothetical protein
VADVPVTQWDLFICHASEDKDRFVRPLAEALARFGVLVWYDDFTLKVGDSISRSIDRGLASSSFGTVVLSAAFFEKAWPEYELQGLTAKEVGSGKVILPIWLGVTRDDVLRYSPPLADKLALHAEGKSVTELAIALIELVRPDIFEDIHKRVAFRVQQARGRREEVELASLHVGGIRHQTLPTDLVGRIRLVRAALLGFYAHSMDFWLKGFQRDAHPSKEVAYWEHLAAVLLEYSAMTRLTTDQAEKLHGLVMAISMGRSEDELKALATGLPDGALETLLALWRNALPPFDIADDEVSVFDESGENIPDAVDVERFPSDLPEDLIDDLLKRQREAGDNDS